MVATLGEVIEDLVPDGLWKQIAALLPPPKPRRYRHPGRRPADDRAALAGIVFVLKTGIAWNQLPASLVGCSGVTCWRRLRDWTEAGGLPLAVSITGGNRNDVTQLLPLVDAIPPIRGLRGRPRRRPRQLLADRGYDYDIYRRQLRDRGITPRIARRGVAHGSGLGKQRWVVERGFAWLHAFKRLRTRYERRADLHLGLLQLACALICYRHLPSL